MLLYHDNQLQQVEVFYKGQSHGFLIPVNLHVNARVRRDKSTGTHLQADESDHIYQGGKLWSVKKDND